MREVRSRAYTKENTRGVPPPPPSAGTYWVTPHSSGRVPEDGTGRVGGVEQGFGGAFTTPDRLQLPGGLLGRIWLASSKV